ncbi:T9SS type A sorting domain-containing protein [Winogradskyella eximia]|uniref:T9SS type A sorting domain-containing protein n=1 Tax=Winogradskyella eximia TaxID=262006 RepID=UPI0024910D6E|nr:T9SS type A sorting domain-containing protein [Winogradskyella eximia]
MKTLLLFTLCLCFSAICLSQTTAIPDPNFEQALIDLGHDSGTIDGTVLSANINSVTELEIWSLNITDLTGIEGFTALEKLWCFNNNISSLEMSNLTALKDLNCSSNNITNLDVSNNTLLEHLICKANDLTSMNVSNNTGLKTLTCNNNMITTIDVSNNTLLETLSFNLNPVTSIDVTNNPNLINLIFSFTSISSIDLSNNPVLEHLICPENQLVNLEVNTNTALINLSCDNNNLSSLNLDNNANLEDLKCRNNTIVSLDLSNNTQLTNLYCDYNQLTSINMKNGNNTILSIVRTENNPNLLCIEVEDAAYSTANWTNIDSQTSFSEDCSALSTNEFNLNSSISVYPNPVTTELNIAIKDNQSITSMELFNMLGKKIATTKALNLDVSPYQSGIYILKVSTKEGQISKRIIIE